MSAPIWIFGYGSLVSPASLERTLDRVVEPDDGWRIARLQGYGRRWNYGSATLRGDWRHGEIEIRSGVVVSLGLEPAHESCNGVAVRVDDQELALLDWREREYECTDITDQIAANAGAIEGRVMTFVPRPSAIERYLTARDAGRAAVRQAYWDLVHAAFAELGEKHLEQLARTPPPDVPIVDVTLVER